MHLRQRAGKSKWLSLLSTSETWRTSYDTWLQKWLRSQMIVFWSNVTWKKLTPELLRNRTCGSFVVHFEVWRQWVMEFALEQHWSEASWATGETRGTICNLSSREWPILLSAIWSVGLVSKEALSMCAVGQWIILMVAFPPAPPGPPPKCSRISRQAGWTNCTKSSDGKNWSHLQIVPLSLSRAKKPWEMLGWPLTVGQFVKQRDFGRAQRAVDEGGKPISTICKSIPESSSIISASSLLHHVASFSKIKIET